MSAKPRLLVYGNCQAGWLTRFLGGIPAVAERYELYYLTDYAVIADDHPTRAPGFFKTVDVCIWQTAATRHDPPFLAAIPATARQIRFPTLWLKMLWPTYVVDPRNHPEPDHPWGRYPYGDRLVLRLLDEGVAPADIPARYRETDLNTIVPLERFARMTLAELRHNDRQSDVAVTPAIEADLRDHKLFGTVNHPTYHMLRVIGDGVLAQLTHGEVAAPAAPANAKEVMGAEEVPLHPQIIEHFGLRWTTPQHRWRYRSKFLDLDAYLHSYAAWEPIAIAEPPQLWLERARQADGEQDHAEAERILLEAIARFPTLTPFLQYLGVLRLRRSAYEEAEQVFRYGLQSHPNHAPFHHQLGVALAQQGLPVPAIASLRSALALDPGLKEAAMLMARLQAQFRRVA